MKPGPIDLDGAETPYDVLRRVTAARFAEAGSLAGALALGDPGALHRFRIACKRVRYALERFAALEPLFAAAAAHVERLTDALGETHDCDLLLAALPPAMPKTRATLYQRRAAHATAAQGLWNDALVLIAESVRYSDGKRAH
jgi:CHAD domain-containing protein